MEPFEVFEHAGFVCELHQDEEPTKPSDWDQLGELVAFDPLWREYRFAERNSTHEEDDALERGGLRLLARYLRMTQGAVIVPFDFHDYGSGGQRLSAGALDDDRAAGFIVTTPERCEQIGCDDPEAGLRGELEDWASYVAGEVVGYVVRDPKTREVADSVWGFYPDGSADRLEYVRQEAREAAESERDARVTRARETRQGWAVARMPVSA